MTGSATDLFKQCVRPMRRPLSWTGRRLVHYWAGLLGTAGIDAKDIVPPSDFVESTRAWAESVEPPLARPAVREIIPASTIRWRPAVTVAAAPHWKFALPAERNVPAAFLASIPGGRVCVGPGAVVGDVMILGPDGRVLADLSLEWGKQPSQYSIYERWRLPRVHKLAGRVALLTAGTGNIYYHWMFDLLPRIEILRRAGFGTEDIDFFVVDDVSCPFQRETLATLGIPVDKVVASRHHPHLSAEQLLAPSFPSRVGNPAPWICEFLRREMRTGPAVPSREERIFITRARAGRRRIRNEADLRELLESRGFRTVAPETLTVAEQADVFASAKCVVGPHGAGFANLVFCEPGTQVIELFSPDYVNLCYLAVASLCDLDYFYLIGNGQTTCAGNDAVAQDMEIDLDRLAELLDMAEV